MPTTDFEKIALLTQENREHPSQQREEDLVQLRMTAGRLLCKQEKPTRPVIPCFDNLFAGIKGIPEVSRQELNRDTLAAGILAHGALLVRGFYSKSEVTFLNSLAESCKSALPRDEVSTAIWAKTLFTLLEFYTGNGLLEAVSEYTGVQPILLAERLKLREHHSGRDNYSAIPWHQDVNFFGGKSFAVNCWAAVTSCGETNPGLGIIPSRCDRRVGWEKELGIAPVNYGNSIEERVIDELVAKYPPVYPVLQPGDALLFDEMTMHKTAPRPWKQKKQIVTISWFFSPAGFPERGTPLAV
jgi:hypothetical protein